MEVRVPVVPVAAAAAVGNLRWASRMAPSAKNIEAKRQAVRNRQAAAIAATTSRKPPPPVRPPGWVPPTANPPVRIHGGKHRTRKAKKAKKTRRTKH